MILRRVYRVRWGEVARIREKLGPLAFPAYAIGVPRAFCISVALAVMGPSAVRAGDAAQDAYERARKLQRAVTRQSPRAQSLDAIAGFEAVARSRPGTEWAVRATFSQGELWRGLYGAARKRADLDAAVAAYARVAKAYEAARSKRRPLADDALWHEAKLRAGVGQLAPALGLLEHLVQRYPDGDMAEQARRELRTLTPRYHVVIDPGHGGKDHGASRARLREKDVVLAIAQRTRNHLTKKGVRVTLTRGDDTYLSLRERSARANEEKADLFVSIHANASPDRDARGIETYYLDVSDDRYVRRLETVENQVSDADVGELEVILADLTNKAHTADSLALATRVQQRLVGAATKIDQGTRDIGVKGALFYVLVGVRMPAILVETSFLSHPQEGRLLASAAYQDALARALADAVLEQLQSRLLSGL